MKRQGNKKQENDAGNSSQISFFVLCGVNINSILKLTYVALAAKFNMIFLIPGAVLI